ncbi:MAG: transglutaminase domain-containing protein [Eubacterium sp.]
MKRLLSVFLSICIVLSCVFSFSVVSYADDEIMTISEAEQYMKEQMLDRQESISFKISADEDLTQFDKSIDHFFQYAVSQENSTSSSDGDYLYQNCSSMSGKMNICNNIFTSEVEYYEFIYDLKYNSTEEQEEYVDAEVAEEVSLINASGDITDFAKIKMVHDYICDKVKYDFDNVGVTEGDCEFRSAYGALMNGKAVCQGYALLFHKICKELGFSTRIVTSETHAWNIIKLGDKYYNVDCTWDDSYNDNSNATDNNYWNNIVTYRFFMRGTGDFNKGIPANQIIHHTLESQFTTDEFMAEYPMAETLYCEHEYEATYVKSATCATQGYTTYTCKICDDKFNGDYVDPNQNHTPVVVEKGKEAGCIINGYSDKIVCSVCGALIQESTIIPAKGGHNKVVDSEYVSPTCDKVGYTEQSHCTLCGITLSQKKEIPALGHSYKTTTISSTCTTKGYTVYECTVCGYTFNGDYVDEIGHAYGNNSPTCLICGVENPNYIPPQEQTTVTESVETTVEEPVTEAAEETVKKPGKTSIVKLSTKKKQLKVKWKKVSNVLGYQIQYSTSKSFTKKTTKTVIVKGKNVSEKSISKLKSGKKYYVRVRTYSASNGKKIYSQWSKTKSIKVK